MLLWCCMYVTVRDEFSFLTPCFPKRLPVSIFNKERNWQMEEGNEWKTSAREGESVCGVTHGVIEYGSFIHQGGMISLPSILSPLHISCFVSCFLCPPSLPFSTFACFFPSHLSLLQSLSPFVSLSCFIHYWLGSCFHFSKLSLRNKTKKERKNKQFYFSWNASLFFPQSVLPFHLDNISLLKI